MLENGMIVGGPAPSLIEDEAASAAERDAEAATADARQAYARGLLLDPARTTDMLYQALATVGPEADQLCMAAAQMLVGCIAGQSPNERLLKILHNLALEVAAEEVASFYPEQFL